MRSAAELNQAYAAAVRAFQSRNLAGAEDICRRILAVQPQHPDALHLMGVVATCGGRHKAAMKLIKQAIRLRGDVPAYHSNLAIALQNDGRHFDALRQYKKALALDPAQPEAHTNMGNILKEQGKVDEALAAFDAAIALAPGIAALHYNRALALQALEREEEAIAGCEQALALDPRYAPAHSDLGIMLYYAGRCAEAERHFAAAREIDPNLSAAYINHGRVLGETGRHDAAVALYMRVLKTDPGNATAQYNLGYSLMRLGFVEPALEAFERCLALSPRMPFVHSLHMHLRQHICAWDDRAREQARMCAVVRRGDIPVVPFTALMLQDLTPAERLACARAAAPRVKARFPHAPSAAPRRRIRIGYLSADYCKHATAYLIAGMIEAHDRERFEIHAYSYSPDDGSDMRRRLESAFDSFTDIRALSHVEAAQRIHDDGIDILVDLKGYTAGARPEILACRPAPVQVNYLGYPGTMGMPEIDYIIGDPTALPMAAQEGYDEKIVHLPHSYQPNDDKREIADDTPTRAVCGLPGEGFVFCSFNNTYKITPDAFDVWMRLLKSVEGSVLWLYEANTLVKGNLEKEAAARGVDPARLVFAARAELPQHLARHRNAGLFLDSLPYNAHTTASDALWAGLPVVTCMGDTFAGRVAAGLLRAVGLPELVTESWADYEALALALARDPVLLQGYKDRLAAARTTAPLFDTRGYTRDLEKAYEEMWRRYAAGGAPAAFAV